MRYDISTTSCGIHQYGASTRRVEAADAVRHPGYASTRRPATATDTYSDVFICPQPRAAACVCAPVSAPASRDPPPCLSARLGVGQARGGDVWAGLELGPDPDWVWDGAAAEDAGPMRAAGRTSLTCHACGLVGAACVGASLYQRISVSAYQGCGRGVFPRVRIRGVSVRSCGCGKSDGTVVCTSWHDVHFKAGCTRRSAPCRLRRRRRVKGCVWLGWCCCLLQPHVWLASRGST
jgi:hypothetical protein